jgi:hypothetical protein
LRQPIEHHERVVRPSAQRLRAREHQHQRRIARRAGLHRAPGQVVERFELAAVGGGQRHRATLLPAAALGAAIGLGSGREQSSEDHENHVEFDPSGNSLHSGRCRQQPNRSGVGRAIGHVVRTSPEVRGARGADRSTRSCCGP